MKRNRANGNRANGNRSTSGSTSASGKSSAGRIGLSTMAIMTCGLAGWSLHSLPRDTTARERIVQGTTIDINSASPEELSLLPGIGPSLAAEITRDRGTHGPFPSLENLGRVRGIGPATLEAIAPYVRADKGI